MNKKLIAAAIAAAMVAPSAFASATMYGKFHTSIDSYDLDAPGSANDVDQWDMKSRSSRLGIKGSEDLGNGLKAIYQAEFTVATDGNDGATGQDGGDGWGGQRNTFIGLAGGFGTFLVGRHDTPMKVAFYGAGTEVLSDSIMDLSLANGLRSPTIPGGGGVTIGATGKSGNSPIGVFSEYRADNAIAYVSPNFAGFTVAAAVIPGENGNGQLEGDGIADHFSLGAMYGGGGLKASVGYQETDVDGNNAPPTGFDTQKTMQIGASYAFGMFKVGAHYEDTSNFGFLDGDDYMAWAITGKATFGNNAVALVYTDSELDSDAATATADTDTQGWGISAEHNFSKRTKVYAAYAADERDVSGTGDTDVDVFSLGMIHSF